jgi:VWFA-related protein
MIRPGLAGIVSLALLLPQTFRSGVDAVRVDVRVTNSKKPVAGLTAADFELRDNGVAQRIDAIAMEDVPLAVALTFDVSESVAGDRLSHLTDAATAAIGVLKTGDRAALLTFSHLLQLKAPFTTDVSKLSAAAGQMTAAGSTGLYDAAFAALTLNDDQTARSLVLLFTDGYDTASWLSAEAVLNVAKRSDAVVYAVGLKNAFHPSPFRVDLSADLLFASSSHIRADSFLSDLTSATGGDLLYADATRDLREHFVAIVEEFKHRYLLSYTPEGVAPTGWHTIGVKLRQRGGTVTARKGYQR